jgi:DNA-binding CsgD family transcriptional regulator
MLDKGIFEPAEIADIAEVSVEYVKKIQRRLQEK